MKAAIDMKVAWIKNDYQTVFTTTIRLYFYTVETQGG